MAAVTAAVIGGTAAIAGGVMAYKAGQAGADATQNAANAQSAAANAQLTAQNKARQTALQLAAPTAGEIAAIDRVTQRNEAQSAVTLQQVTSGLSALASIDPAIKSAGDQAYQVLQGQQSQLLAPIQAQRSRQRQDLENQLAARLGPGFRSSSAGIEAINKFDQATNESLAGAQQQTLLTLGNFFTGASSARTGISNSINDATRVQQAGDQIELNAEGQIQNRQVAAWNGAAPTAGNAVVTAAGNSQAGNVAAATNNQNLGSAIGSLGAQAVGFGVGAVNTQNQQQQMMTQFTNALSSLQSNGAFAGMGMGSAPTPTMPMPTQPTLGVNYNFGAN